MTDSDRQDAVEALLPADSSHRIMHEAWRHSHRPGREIPVWNIWAQIGAESFASGDQPTFELALAAFKLELPT